MRHPFAVLAATLLLGCDEPTLISHVDRLPGLSGTDLRSMQDGRGIPVEIHGTPFAGVSPADLANALRAPAALASGIRFYAADPGAWQGGHGTRLVLHFNPSGPPNARADCRRTTAAANTSRTEGAFSVNAAFCVAEDWQAHGFMKVLKIERGDLTAYTDVMQSLFHAIFREEPDR